MLHLALNMKARQTMVRRHTLGVRLNDRELTWVREAARERDLVPAEYVRNLLRELHGGSLLERPAEPQHASDTPEALDATTSRVARIATSPQDKDGAASTDPDAVTEKG